MDYKYQVRLVASSISKAGMPYTKHENLCSVRYSLVQPLFSFNCPMSIAVWRVGCTLVYRPWPTSWLSRPDQFGRGNIIVHRLSHVDKADCLSLLASVCICLNIACACLPSFDLLFSKVWERLERCPLPSLIGQLSESA